MRLPVAALSRLDGSLSPRAYRDAICATPVTLVLPAAATIRAKHASYPVIIDDSTEPALNRQLLIIG